MPALDQGVEETVERGQHGRRRRRTGLGEGDGGEQRLDEMDGIDELATAVIEERANLGGRKR